MNHRANTLLVFVKNKTHHAKTQSSIYDNRSNLFLYTTNNRYIKQHKLKYTPCLYLSNLTVHNSVVYQSCNFTDIQYCIFTILPMGSSTAAKHSVKSHAQNVNCSAIANQHFLALL